MGTIVLLERVGHQAKRYHCVTALGEFTHDITRASACYSENARIRSDEPRVRTSRSRKRVGLIFPAHTTKRYEFTILRLSARLML